MLQIYISNAILHLFIDLFSAEKNEDYFEGTAIFSRITGESGFFYFQVQRPAAVLRKAVYIENQKLFAITICGRGKKETKKRQRAKSVDTEGVKTEKEKYV